MNTKIAIKGHKVHHELVINILRFLGGKDDRWYTGNIPGMNYFIDERGYITGTPDPPKKEKYIIYTLEGIMAKLLTVNYPRQVLVSADNETWHTRVMFGYDPNLIDPYLCYADIEILEDIESRQMRYMGWRYMKEIEEQITELTIAQIAKKLNIKVENLKIISDEK